MAASDHLGPQFLDLYHHTTPENADAIVSEGSMRGIGGRAYFSNQAHGMYGGDYGPSAVHVRVPEGLVKPDDSFRNGEKFYVGRAADIKPEHIMGRD